MLIEAAKGGHTNVVQVLIDYPNSLVTTGIMEAAAPAVTDQAVATAASDKQQPQAAAAAGQEKGAYNSWKKLRAKDGQAAGSNYLDYPEMLEGSGFVLEGLEEKGLDAKSYIQTMLRRTEGSSKEEQIYQKEQILAELQVRSVNI